VQIEKANGVSGKHRRTTDVKEGKLAAHQAAQNWTDEGIDDLLAGKPKQGLGGHEIISK
jgi:hypothetical protein